MGRHCVPSLTLLLFVGPTVLVLAGIELISFTVASMGLCFGFVLKTVLIIQGCFSYTELRPLLFLTLPHQRVGWA